MRFPFSRRFLTLLALVGLPYACSRPRDEILPLPSYGVRLMSHEKLQALRADVQDREIAELKKLPNCYLQRMAGTTRALKFDAIADCASTFRAGQQDDGGKWLCNPDQITKGTVVYGFGIAEDYSFDKDMAEVFGAEVHMFDPGPDVERAFADFKQPRRFGEGTVTYHPIGLGPTSDDPAHAYCGRSRQMRENRSRKPRSQTSRGREIPKTPIGKARASGDRRGAVLHDRFHRRPTSPSPR